VTEQIRVHVFTDKRLTAETLQDVYGMQEVRDLTSLGLVSGLLTQESIDSLRALNVSVYPNYERQLPPHEVADVPQDAAPVRLFKRARSWLRLNLDDIDDGYR
jgi:hypothetical protein